MINYCYTKPELEQLLKSIVILCDTREQVNSHITDYFNKHAIAFKKQKLDYGDYSFMLPANKDIGIIRPISFQNSIIIERKANLEELSNNLTVRRTELENGSYRDILEHKYNTKYNPKSFLATLKTYENRYNLNINYISSLCSGNFIYFSFYYYLREYLIG